MEVTARKTRLFIFLCLVFCYTVHYHRNRQKASTTKTFSGHINHKDLVFDAMSASE
jgi:dipeptide/tripeptide permease